MTAEPVTGGCLCGAVRYQADGPPNHASLCHCRMCQRHFGNAIGGYASFPRARLRFTKGAAKNYRSSDFAQRGFCAACGSPLTYEYSGAPERISVTLGSLDQPERFPPSVHWGIESQVPWLHIDDDLPRHRTEDDPEFQEFAQAAAEGCG